MVFDSKKPYGLIYGHPMARFEQNGHHFDALGRILKQEVMDQIEQEATIKKAEDEKKKKEEEKLGKKKGRPPGSKNKAKAYAGQESNA